MSVIVGSGYPNALRLKDLLGRDQVRLIRSGRHPIASGFTAVDRWLRGANVLEEEKDDALSLEIFAKELFEFEPDWKPIAQVLLSHIAKASECAAIRFEMRVSTYVLRPCAKSVQWTRYSSGFGDLMTVTPDLLVECKLIRKGAGSDDMVRLREQILSQASDAQSQKRSVDVPFVVAVGFDSLFPQMVIDHLVTDMLHRERWFEEHPDISSLLVFTPHPPIRRRISVLGMIGGPRNFGGIVEIRNKRAVYPLPPEISLKASNPIHDEILAKITDRARN